MGYTQVSVTGISSMFSQEEFESDVSLGDTKVYPDVASVRAKAQEYATQQCWHDVRKLRNIELEKSDYIASVAMETGVGVSTAWRNYRQELRDITKQSDVNNIVWPTHPEGVRVGFQTGYEPCSKV
jgi:adenosylmethionine-8-amino-7-oxononanoate aminotransferase